MKIFALALFVLTLHILGSPALAAELERHAAAPPETDHFAPLLGTWEVEARRLSRDGSTWKEAEHPAQWRFYRILDGHAIQDDFISPAPGIDVPESARTYGTNIRIYNAKQQHWEMAWIDSGAREAREFSAVSKPGEIVMSSKDTEQRRRITFYEITESSFRWRQEWTFDGGATWVPVSYLEAKRKS
jgi:hypothetical protein